MNLYDYKRTITFRLISAADITIWAYTPYNNSFKTADLLSRHVAKIYVYSIINYNEISK